MATHHQQQQPHHHHQQHRSPSCSSTPASSDLDITTSDHFYLSPKFYENNVVVVPGGDQSRKENSPATLNGKVSRTSTTTATGGDAVASVQRKLFANEAPDVLVQNNTTPTSVLANGKHQDYNSPASDSEGVLTEQDAGCFNNNNNNNNANSSTKRHLVTLNGPSHNGGNKPMLVVTADARKLNGTPVSHLAEAAPATSFGTPAPTAACSSYKKDLTPRQVKRRFDWDSGSEDATTMSPVIGVQPAATVASLVTKTAPTTMTTLNGKKTNISVRTYKLTNAMQQSLVAAGCNTAVAVAAVTANLAQNGNSAGGNSVSGGTFGASPNANGVAGSPIVNCQSPTTFAIVNQKNPISIVSNANTMTPTNNGSAANQQQQVIFKTPLTPKSAQFSATDSPNTPSSAATSSSIYVVSTNGNLILEPKMVVNTAAAALTPPVTRRTSAAAELKANNKPNARGGKRAAATTPAGGKSNAAANKRARNSHENVPRYQHQTIKQEVEDEDEEMISYMKGDLRSLQLANSSAELGAFFSSPYHSMNNGGQQQVMSSLPLGISSSGSSRSTSSSSSPCYEQQHQYPAMANGRPSSAASSSSSSTTNPQRTRYETSLGQLTRKFISLLQQSKDGSINLNEASGILQVQKRRIYDITNVLEGVGLLHKTYKNNIQLRGGLKDYFCGNAQAIAPTSAFTKGRESNYRNRNPPPLSLLFSGEESSTGRSSSTHKKSSNNRTSYNYNDEDRSMYSPPSDQQLLSELSELENDENQLDNLLRRMSAETVRIKKNYASKLYVTYLDLRQVPEFANQTVIGIRPPTDTTLEVPDPFESLQIWLKNLSGRTIEVYLCPEQSKDGTSKPRFNIKMVSDDIASIKKEQKEKHQQQQAAKRKLKEAEANNTDNASNAGLDSGFGSSSNATKSCGSMSSAAGGMLAASSTAGAGGGNTSSPLSSMASSSSSFMSHHQNAMLSTMNNNDMLAVAASLSGMPGSDNYDLTEDSMLSSSSIFDDFESSIHNDYNSSELSSQLDDDYHGLMGSGLNGLNDGGGGSGPLPSSMSSYRNPMLMDDPFGQQNAPPSSLISLELSATHDYDFGLDPQEGIADLFDGSFD